MSSWCEDGRSGDSFSGQESPEDFHNLEAIAAEAKTALISLFIIVQKLTRSMTGAI